MKEITAGFACIALVLAISSCGGGHHEASATTLSVMATGQVGGPLRAPEGRRLNVAFVMTEGATMIDFAGPWEVFQDVHLEGAGMSMEQQMPFRLYTVGESKEHIRTSGGMQVTPDFTFANAPDPDIVVIGAQRGSKGLHGWVRESHEKNALILSVCTGAFKVAQTGLLDGKTATTHHDFFEDFAEQHPKVTLVRSRRFVKADDRIYTAGGLTSGIDLALHVVELYFGRETAVRTADYMEYESKSWIEPVRSSE